MTTDDRPSAGAPAGERVAQFLTLYRERRYEQQRGWYDERLREYRRAHDQIITAIAVALFFASAAGVLAGTDALGVRTLWAVVATVSSGVATVLGAYDSLVGYEHIAKIYGDARAALARLQAEAPWSEEAVDQEALQRFVVGVEAVVQNEMHQWGQLTGRYATPDLPTSSPPSSAPRSPSAEP